MGSEYPEGDPRSHRGNHGGNDENRGDPKRRYRDGPLEKHSHRHRSQDRGNRGRSRSPGSRDRRSRSRDRERWRKREMHRAKEGRGKEKENENRDEERQHQKRSYRDREGIVPVRGTRDSGHYRDSDRREGQSSSTARSNADTVNPDEGRSLVKRRGPLPSQNDSFAISNGEEPEKPVEKPNFGTTGLLAAASNTVTQADGSMVTLKYHEPPEARKPAPRDVWKLFVFKGSDIIDTIDLSSRSCWLIGRDSAVVDLPAEHPSISKQHAVVQFRYTEKRNEYGDKIGRVKPYLIDLESANGTLLNNEKVPESRYLELRDKDMVQFGSSTREYVLMLAPRD